MAQHLLPLLVLLLTAAASTCITALTSASPPLPVAFFSFFMWGLASAALGVHLPRLGRGGAERRGHAGSRRSPADRPTRTSTSPETQLESHLQFTVVRGRRAGLRRPAISPYKETDRVNEWFRAPTTKIIWVLTRLCNEILHLLVGECACVVLR
uniref:DUF4220 domain-containing protein n=1 Tax=Setaria italica TaxID=4555 RepID=K3Z0S6_SETIT